MAHIIHIVGKVGAGKSHFIRKYLSQYPVFDIQEIYREYSISPKDIQANYDQFSNALEHTLEAFYHEYQHLPYIVIESSGINKLINSFLQRRDHSTCLIISTYSEKIENRPYAGELNALIDRKIASNAFPVNCSYNVHTKQYTPYRPDWAV